MDFLKVKRFRKASKPNLEKGEEDKPVESPEELKIENDGDGSKSAKADPAAESGNEIEEDDDDDDDDDFIMNEVKRRLKELRRNSFMGLIPEETCQEVEEEEEEEEEVSSSNESRNAEVESYQTWCGFDELYEKYCERMLFFDKMSAQQLREGGSLVPLNPSPRSASKKLAFSLRSLSFKKRDEPQDDGELLQEQQQPDPYLDLETAYVAHLCLTWETLHCQYTQLNREISFYPERPTCYSHAAQQFQQFQVLLQRFIENEPFEQGPMAESYAKTRSSFPKLLQVPRIQGTEKKGTEEEEWDPVLASDLVNVIESSILTFRVFLKMDKRKPGSVLNIFGGHNQLVTPLQQVQSSLEKKEMKLKELFKKKKGWKKKSWPATREEVELLFALIDIKVVARALRMARIGNEQLFWCEEKLSKLDLSENKLKRDGSAILFPC